MQRAEAPARGASKVLPHIATEYEVVAMTLDGLLMNELAGHVRMSYPNARDRYAELGVDADAAIDLALETPLSVHCWQADDVIGLETHEEGTDAGGIQATGNYRGRARNGEEIRADFETAADLIPGTLRFNLHAMYAETDGAVVDRDELEPEHFAPWIDWCEQHEWGLDFNPTCFAHPKMRDGMTLSSTDKATRQFWIDHCIASRRIADAIAQRLGPGTCNIWIPDGRKDVTADRMGPRERLLEALDEVLAEDLDVIDTVESKLFGIGAEDYTVGSHEFYLAYAATRGCGLCFDMGHYHPTEKIADKISAAIQFVSPILLHCSRGVRWDSDHVTRFNDDLRAVCTEAVRSDRFDDILWATDFFDASINRIAAWVLGERAVRKSLLSALLEPHDLAVVAEYSGVGHAKLALDELRSELPFGTIWEELCERAGVPTGIAWLAEIRRYEEEVLSEREA